MKKLILPLFALISYSSNAQFSIQPQIGIETSRTTVNLNDLASFSPMGMQIAPRLSVRMAYQLKTGHGAFLGIATSSPAVEFKFNDPQLAQTSYTASAKELGLRLEGGYQFSSKPITLRKPVYTKVFSNRSGHRNGGGEQRIYGGQGRCGQRSSARDFSPSSYRTIEKVKGLYMRIKPSAGLAFASSESNIETETKGGQTTYEYEAGLNTALIAGTAFEFGSRNQTKFVVSLNYLKSLGNNSQTLTTGSVVKPNINTFSSRTSGFNLSVGIPISLKKKAEATAQPKQCNRSSYEGRCGRYKM